MRTSPQTVQMADAARVSWVDYAKGLCILLVVTFHSVNHYEAAVGQTGWLRAAVDFSMPFRMPDFFLVSGLFLSRTINAPLRDYVDKKVVHFAYFYFLWLAITLGFTDHDTLRANPVEFVRLFVWNIIQPTGVLWFVHMLAVFYVLTRLVRSLPKWTVLAAAAALQIAHQGGWIDTPSFIANRLMDYFVYFFLGYAISGAVFAMADRVRARPRATLAVLAAWALGNHVMTSQDLHTLPGVGLLMGLAGAIAVIEVSTLLSLHRFASFIRYCGKNSIVIYLTFFFPMTALERILSQHQVIPDVGWASLLIVAMSAALPLIFHRMIKGTPLIALYERPDWAKIGARRLGLRRAEA